ncbi:FecR family protein [Luteimonas salinilitoris]|uniref:FecR domain-containing protein n=1 Tax=Luteimonas salinilitoris TaxID=3237697 RepID=A0ABV4HU30_9GAMM
MNEHIDNRRIAARSAEEWVVRLRAPDCTPEEHAAFEDWLAEAPERIAGYVEAERVHTAAGRLSTDPLLAAATRRIKRDMTHGAAKEWRRRWPLAAAAAAVVLAGVVGYRLLLPVPAADQRIATAVGERHEAVLDDGSRIVLDTDSTLDIAFADRERTLTLTHGRVYIEAASDPARPMLVHAANGTVRVVGTKFQLQNLGGEVVVGLFEGSVTVTAGTGARSHTLAPDQQLAYDRHGDFGPVQPLRASDAQAWTGGKLVFSDRPLDVLVEEANRYSDTKLVLAEPALARIRVSGVFQAGDQQALVDALRKGWNLHAEKNREGDIILRTR